MHVQDVLHQKTGELVSHGCGCNHVVMALLAGERFSAPRIPSDLKETVAREFLDHAMSEIYLIFVAGFPHRMNPEDLRSAEVMGHLEVVK